MSLQEGDSFRLDGLAVIFDAPTPKEAEISTDCGPAPTYIPSSLRTFETCAARLNKFFTHDDFITLEAQQDTLTLQTVPATESDGNSQVAQERCVGPSGFSLHAGVVAQQWERKKLDRLSRDITRPAISEQRLSITPAGNVRYQLKTPYRKSLPHERSE